MGGASELFGKEVREFLKTWRLWVLGGFFLFFAFSSPLLAKITPQLLTSLTASQPGVVIKIPEPTWADSYAQWLKNVSQTGVFIVLIIGAGMVASEIASGTGILVLTKPVSRAWFVVVKAATLMGFLVATVVVGTAIVQVETLAIFGAAPFGALWGGVVAWLLFASMLVGMMALLSCSVSTLAAAGLGVLGFFALSAMQSLLRLPVPLWPVAALLLLAAAVWTFSRREL